MLLLVLSNHRIHSIFIFPCSCCKVMILLHVLFCNAQNCTMYSVHCTVYCTVYNVQDAAVQQGRRGVSPYYALTPDISPMDWSSYILELRALPPIRGLNELDSWKPFLLTPSTAHVSQAIALSFNVVMSWTTANLNSSTLEKYGPSVVADQILWSVFIPKLPGYHL